MVRPGQDRLQGRVEVDETYVGGAEEGVRSRQTVTKALVAIAVETPEDGAGIGRIRTRVVADALAASLLGFVREAVEPGSTVHADGWPSYAPLQELGYAHEGTVLRDPRLAGQLLPHVHRIAALFKRCWAGTHPGAISARHLDYYLDEFSFRFKRRKSRSRGKLFYRQAQQAVAIEPTPYRSIVGGKSRNGKP